MLGNIKVQSKITYNDFSQIIEDKRKENIESLKNYELNGKNSHLLVRNFMLSDIFMREIIVGKKVP